MLRNEQKYYITQQSYPDLFLTSVRIKTFMTVLLLALMLYQSKQ